MQDQTIDEMYNNLNRIVSNFQSKRLVRQRTTYNEFTVDEEQNRILVMLKVLIGTKILNSYCLALSKISRQNDLPIMQSFKDLIYQLKDLSYINERCMHVEGSLSSKETTFLLK